MKNIIYYENNKEIKKFNNFIVFLHNIEYTNIKNTITNRVYYINPNMHKEFKKTIKQILSNIDKTILYEINKLI